jgi:hypothetical protein
MKTEMPKAGRLGVPSMIEVGLAATVGFLIVLWVSGGLTAPRMEGRRTATAETHPADRDRESIAAAAHKVVAAAPATAAVARSPMPPEVDRWWAYTKPKVPLAGMSLEGGFLRIAAGAASVTEVAFEEARRVVPPGNELWFVGEHRLRRFVRYGPDLGGGGSATRWASSAADAAPTSVHVLDAVDRRSIPALLIDSEGRPLGPVDAPSSRMVLTHEFRGSVVAARYLPRPVGQVTPGEVLVVELREAAFLSGRLVGASCGPDTHLLVHDSELVSEPSRSEEVPITASGEFEAGPIAAGRRRLFLSSRTVILRTSPRVIDVELRAGDNDLGSIDVEPLGVLHLRVVTQMYPLPETVHLLCWSDGSDRPAHMDAPEFRVESDGMVRREQVRRGPVWAQLWTADGWASEPRSFDSVATAWERPAEMELRPPIDVQVQVDTAPFELGTGARITIHPPGSLPVGSRWRSQPTVDAPARQVRQRTLGPGGMVEIPGVWSGSAVLSLIAADGSLLAAHRMELGPGRSAAVRLDLRAALGQIEVQGPPARRIALAREGEGTVVRSVLDERGRARIVVRPGVWKLRTIDFADDEGQPLAVRVEVGLGRAVFVSL